MFTTLGGRSSTAMWWYIRMYCAQANGKKVSYSVTNRVTGLYINMPSVDNLIELECDPESLILNFLLCTCSSLCCQCGAATQPNPSNMCVACLRTQVDITEGIPKQVHLNFCKACERYVLQDDDLKNIKCFSAFLLFWFWYQWAVGNLNWVHTNMWYPCTNGIDIIYF